jgi:poly(hydroxyalkanoate) granule-associated protein
MGKDQFTIYMSLAGGFKMNQEDQVVEQAEQAQAGKEEYGPLLETVRKVLLAGIGVVALAQEEVEDFVDKLVERGEIAERDGRKLIRDLKEKRFRKGKAVEDDLDQRIEQVLHGMNIPTKADIDALSVRIAKLTEKVEALQ